MDNSNTNRSVLTMEPAVATAGVCKGRNLTGVVAVLYSDGDTAYRCTDCTYEANSPQRVSSHRRTHTYRQRPRKTSRTRQVEKALKVLTTLTEEPSPDAVAALNRKIASLQSRLSTERKARKEAEANLAAIRRALQG